MSVMVLATEAESSMSQVALDDEPVIITTSPEGSPRSTPPPPPCTPPLPELDSSNFHALVSVARADRTIQQTKLELRWLLLIETCACTIVTLIWLFFIQWYLSFLWHIPWHPIRVIVSRKVYPFMFPDLLSILDRTTADHASSGNFDAFFKWICEEEILCRADPALFDERKNKISLLLIISSACFFFDFCSILVKVFGGVEYASASVELFFHLVFFYVDAKFFYALRHVLSPIYKEKDMSWAAAKSALFGERGLFGNGSDEPDTRRHVIPHYSGHTHTTSGQDKYDMSSVLPGTVPTDMNRISLETGNLGVIDTRTNMPLQQSDVT